MPGIYPGGPSGPRAADVARQPVSMKCERCMADDTVERHVVDGFTGYLCARCRSEWDQIS